MQTPYGGSEVSQLYLYFLTFVNDTMHANLKHLYKCHLLVIFSLSLVFIITWLKLECQDPRLNFVMSFQPSCPNYPRDPTHCLSSIDITVTHKVGAVKRVERIQRDFLPSSSAESSWDLVSRVILPQWREDLVCSMLFGMLSMKYESNMVGLLTILIGDSYILLNSPNSRLHCQVEQGALVERTKDPSFSHFSRRSFD